MKSIVSGALLAFTVLAVVFVARDAATPKDTAPAAAPAAMVTAAQKAAGTTIARVDIRCCALATATNGARHEGHE